MKVIDTSKESLDIFAAGQFDLRKWEHYIDKAVPGAKELCLDGMQKCICAGFSWEDDYLPVLNAVATDREKWDEVLKSFRKVTGHLEEKILRRFHKTVDTDVILYLGLCNSAGRVVTINDRAVVLLGIEKIMELNWCDIDPMTGLIIHELGHVYQAQYGVMDLQTDSVADQFLWQLFTEGVAMVFVRYLLQYDEFDQIIQYRIHEVRKYLNSFVEIL